MTRIGFVGLGSMGLPMAKVLAAKGFAVTGFDLRAAAMQELAAAGGKAADSVAAMPEPMRRELRDLGLL